MLSDKIVLLTGASGGIGLTALKSFAPQVKKLIASSRENPSDLIEDAALLDKFEFIPNDLTKEENVQKLFSYVEKKYGRLDILINTIGGSLFSHPLEEFPLEEFNQVIQVNLTSAFLLTKEAFKLMKKNGDEGGNIVHIVSSSAKRISTNKGPYGIAKSGLASLIQYAAAESAKYNIKVNGLSPTYVFTERHENDIVKKIEKSDKSREQILEHIFESQLLKRPQYPEDLIDALILLATTNSMTAQIINCTMGEVISY